MGMSSSVVGFKPEDSKWKEMKAAYNACQAAGVPTPDEISKFFDWGDPNEMAGMVVNIKKAVKPYSAEAKDGFEVDLAALPKDVKVLRFINSY